MRTQQQKIRAVNAIDIVETAYRLDGTETEWLDALLTKARPDLDTGSGVYAFTGDDSVPDFAGSAAFVQHDLQPGFGARLAELNRDAPSAIFDLVRSRLVTCGGLVRSLGTGSPVVAHFQAVMAPVGIVDGFSMFAKDADGGSIDISAPATTVVDPPPRVRGIWTRVGLHVASALRLRRKLAARATHRDALLAPSGRLEDASATLKDDRTALRTLVEAVKSMERARSASERSSPERALDLWQGLVAGEWSLVEHWESGGRRYLAAYRNRPELRDPRALTRVERTMLKYLALAATNKDIMYALGLPAGTVSAAVTQLMRKLRVKRRVDLALLADPSRMDRLDVARAGGGELGVLAVDVGLRGGAVASLSAAELAVAGFAIRGWSNGRIASEREVSLHTVANQLRSVYEKLGVKSRSELARALTS